MKAYPEERKEALVRRMMAPENALISALARETGIAEQTLYTWRRQAKGQGLAVPGGGNTDKNRCRRRPRYVNSRATNKEGVSTKQHEDAGTGASLAARSRVRHRILVATRIDPNPTRRLSHTV